MKTLSHGDLTLLQELFSRHINPVHSGTNINFTRNSAAHASFRRLETYGFVVISGTERDQTLCASLPAFKILPQ